MAPSNPFGPRRRAFSGDPKDAVIAASKSGQPHVLWIDRLGVLFSRDVIVALFVPARDRVEFNPGATTKDLRHAYFWAHSLHTLAAPSGAVHFHRAALEEIARAAEYLHAIHNPVEPIHHAIQ